MQVRKLSQVDVQRASRGDKRVASVVPKWLCLPSKSRRRIVAPISPKGDAIKPAFDTNRGQKGQKGGKRGQTTFPGDPSWAKGQRSARAARYLVPDRDFDRRLLAPLRASNHTRHPSQSGYFNEPRKASEFGASVYSSISSKMLRSCSAD